MPISKRFGWFVYDSLEYIGEFIGVIGFLCFIASLCLIGPPFPPDPSARLTLLGIVLLCMTTSALVTWAGFRISDEDGPRFWIQIRLIHGNNMSIRAVFKASQALRRSGIVDWSTQHTAEVLAYYVTGERTEPLTNGQQIAWDAYRKYR